MKPLVCVIESSESTFCHEVGIEREILGDIAEVRLVTIEGRDASAAGAIAAADALIVSHHPRISAELIGALSRVKVIARNGAGFDNVDGEAARAAGIPVCNVPDYGTEEVADHALLLTLALQRRLRPVLDCARSGAWDWRAAEPGRRLRGQVFGIVGCGRIGTAAALRAKAFAFRVVFYDPYVASGYEKALNVERVRTLTELFAVADVVSLHAPLTPETRGMIGFVEIEAMERRPFLVNTARGPLVREAAVLAGLNTGKLAGAALDVTEHEPAVDAALLAHPNCLVTPHMAFYSAEALRDMRAGAARLVRQVFETGRAGNVVNGYGS